MKPGEPLPAGHLLDGRYRINRIIGQGGMGRVYLANDIRLANRPVAVKEMMVGAGDQEKKAIEDFQREANVLAALSHPGIPNLFDNFVENARHYLVMEFVAGGDLQGLLDKLGAGARIPEPKVLRWARQILDVLAFLHAQQPPIVYRDFKPGNIMIDGKGRAMLIDFGIARFLPPGGRGTQIGSVGYAPPEQYLGKAEPRSDLYSLAATMHHLLTGRDPQLEPPFSFPPPRRLAPEVSLPTERVVMGALERDIQKRPSSAREMADRLPVPSDADDGTSIGTPMPSRAPSPISLVPTAVLSQPSAAGSAAARESRKASGLQKLARIAAPLARNPPAPAPLSSVRVSSTAKTRELKKSGQPPASEVAIQASARADSAAKQPQTPMPARSAVPPLAAPAVQPSSPTPRSLRLPSVQSNGRMGKPAPQSVDGPRLISRIEPAEFAMVGQRIVIGRAANPADKAEIDIDLSTLKRGADRISRRHAEVVKLGRDYFIRDLGSLNGTYISGRGRLGRDQLYKLNDRDEVLLGGARLEFRKG